MINYIYRHRLKIVVLFFFIVGVLLGDFCNISKLYYGYDKNQYDEACRLFASNEKEAFDILKNINVEDAEYSIKELKNGVYLWTENINIVNNISRIENITVEIKQRNMKLRRYCKLRILYFACLKNNLKKGMDDIYDNKVNKIESKINRYLKENNLN